MIEFFQDKCEGLNAAIKYERDKFSGRRMNELEKIVANENIKASLKELDFFYAWRMVFLDAWTQVSKVK